MIRCPNCLIKFKPGEDQGDLAFCPSCLYVFKISSVKLRIVFENLAKNLKLYEVLDFLENTITIIKRKIKYGNSK